MTESHANPRGGPRQNVKLALFALSGNQCAFPGCGAAMFEDGSIIGEICHINAQRPGGPRFDDSLDDERLHAIENLILLCSKHHKVVDDHPAKFDALWLRGVKSGHETSIAPAATAEMLHRLVDALAKAVPVDWWARPGAPVFRLGLASSRPKDRSVWTFEAEITQIDGGDIGDLRHRFQRGDDDSEMTAPILRERRHWRARTLSFTPSGESVMLELRFWWDGAERSVSYVWAVEDAFQSADVTIVQA